MAKSLWGHYPTPETESQLRGDSGDYDSYGWCVHADFARDLERQVQYWKDKYEKQEQWKWANI